MEDKEYIRFMMDNIKVGDTLICINDRGNLDSYSPKRFDSLQEVRCDIIDDILE